MSGVWGEDEIMLKCGDLIDNRYRITDVIGQGGMSIVYLAYDVRLEKYRAVKSYRNDKDDVNNKISFDALVDEANFLKRLEHISLPKIVDVICEEDDGFYIVMDYIKGVSLDKCVEQNGAQSQENVVEWGKQICDALDYLHSQNPPIIYRDIKPSNIILKPDGNICLIDFGIAREYKVNKSADTKYIGTIGYAAPEQYGGKGQTDARTDIYSLGATLYNLLTAKNINEEPFETSVRYWDSSISKDLDAIVNKCIQTKPQERFQSANELLAALNKVDFKNKKSNNKMFFIILSVMIFVITAITVLFLCLSSGKDSDDVSKISSAASDMDSSAEKVPVIGNKSESLPSVQNNSSQNNSIVSSEIVSSSSSQDSSVAESQNSDISDSSYQESSEDDSVVDYDNDTSEQTSSVTSTTDTGSHTVSSNGDLKSVLTVNKTTFNVGEQVKCMITINSDELIYSQSLTVYYDSFMFDFVSAKGMNFVKSSGKIAFTDSCNTKRIVCEIVLVAKKSGSSSLILSDITAGTADGGVLMTHNEGCKLTVN